ncbi:hypothetical protein D3C75_1308340 [compost metagenome]
MLCGAVARRGTAFQPIEKTGEISRILKTQAISGFMHRAGTEQQHTFGFTQQAIEYQSFGGLIGETPTQVIEP